MCGGVCSGCAAFSHSAPWCCQVPLIAPAVLSRNCLTLFISHTLSLLCLFVYCTLYRSVRFGSLGHSSYRLVLVVCVRAIDTSVAPRDATATHKVGYGIPWCCEQVVRCCVQRRRRHIRVGVCLQMWCAVTCTFVRLVDGKGELEDTSNRGKTNGQERREHINYFRPRCRDFGIE